MKILFLINGENFRSLFVKLGQQFILDGHSVVFALDTKMTNYTCPEYKIEHKCYYFTEYFREHYKCSIK